MLKFLLIILAAIIGNGLGAWNIRTISSSRYVMTGILTFTCIIVQQSALKQVYTNLNGWYILAWAIGSTIGIVGSIWIDKKWLKRK